MKNNARIAVYLLLLLAPQVLLAQGTEKALEAFFQILLGFGIWLAIALVLLILVAFNRSNKYYSIVAYSVSAITLLVTLYFNFSISNDYGSRGPMRDLTSYLVFGCFVYGSVVWLLSKKSLSPSKLNPESSADAIDHLGPVVRKLQYLLASILVYSSYHFIGLCMLVFDGFNVLHWQFAVSLVNIAIVGIALHQLKNRSRIAWMLLAYVLTFQILIGSIGLFQIFYFNLNHISSIYILITVTLLPIAFLASSIWAMVVILKPRFFSAFLILPNDRLKVIIISIIVSLTIVLSWKLF